MVPINHACPLCVRSLRSFLISGDVLFDVVLLLLCTYILNVHAIQAASELIRRAKLAAKLPESKSFLEASPFHQGNKKGGNNSATIVPEVWLLLMTNALSKHLSICLHACPSIQHIYIYVCIYYIYTYIYIYIWYMSLLLTDIFLNRACSHHRGIMKKRRPKSTSSPSRCACDIRSLLSTSSVQIVSKYFCM